MGKKCFPEAMDALRPDVPIALYLRSANCIVQEVVNELSRHTRPLGKTVMNGYSSSNYGYSILNSLVI